MGVALDPAYNWPEWPNWPDSATPPDVLPLKGGADESSIPSAPTSYAAWQLTPERQRHEWRRTRRAIISTRIRLLVAGHCVFLASCVGLNLLSNAHVCSNFAWVGCYSLLLTSVVLLICEWLHVRFPPRHPPRFVVRTNGVTEYGDEGPRNHWDWTRVRQLRLVADRERPEFRSLVFVTSGYRWMEKFHDITVPLPDAAPADLASIGEREAIGAVGVALAENGFQWKAQMGKNELKIHRRS